MELVIRTGTRDVARVPVRSLDLPARTVIVRDREVAAKQIEVAAKEGDLNLWVSYLEVTGFEIR